MCWGWGHYQVSVKYLPPKFTLTHLETGRGEGNGQFTHRGFLRYDLPRSSYLETLPCPIASVWLFPLWLWVGTCSVAIKMFVPSGTCEDVKMRFPPIKFKILNFGEKQTKHLILYLLRSPTQVPKSGIIMSIYKQLELALLEGWVIFGHWRILAFTLVFDILYSKTISQ